MTDTKTICWFAGLLEGEGAFTECSGWRGLARIEFTSTDYDIAVRVSDLLKAPVKLRHVTSLTRKTAWQVRLARRAEVIGWLMTLYPLMGTRRQARFRYLIATWRSSPTLKRRGLEKVPK